MTDSSKTELRLKFKNIRNSITKNQRVLKSKIIRDKLFEIIERKNYTNIFIYNSFSSEVMTGDIISKLVSKKINVYLPKCNIYNETMQAVKYNSTDVYTENIYGIKESSNHFIEMPNRLDLIVAPGIVFDKKGNRIGYGKGYYDKFIKSLNYKPALIGLCYSEQIYHEEIDADLHDEKMDMIITDMDTFICKR